MGFTVCKGCKKEMSLGNGCLPFDKIDRIPYGQETRFGNIISSGHCHDCNVGIGQFHHLGCDMEECPKCGRQFFCCDCEFD